MSRQTPDPTATAEARKLLRRLAIRNPTELDVELIAIECGAYVRFAELVGEDGHLVRRGKTHVIAVNRSGMESARWRFTIAHELGHLLCQRGANNLRVCTDGDFRDWGRRRSDETAANHFAAELLMPEHLFAPLCEKVNRPTLRDVRALAARFDTSLTATALRFVYCSPEPCAVVHSKAGIVEWSAHSEDFAPFIRNGTKVGPRTCAAEIVAGKEREVAPDTMEASEWCSDSGCRDLEVQEHSMRLGATGSILTLLWHKYS